jgi:hypothetical protein
MTDETGGEPPKRLKNPRSAARPSIRSQGASGHSRSHQGLGGGAISLTGTPWRKRPLLAKHGIDKRSPAYLETQKLITEIETDLGGADQLSAAERQLVQHAALLGAMLADMELSYLAGKAIDTSEYGFLVGVQHRLFSLIGLRRRARDVTPSIDEYLAAKEPTGGG